MNKKSKFWLVAFVIFFAILIWQKYAPVNNQGRVQNGEPTPTPTPRPPRIEIYTPPAINPADSYTIIFVGDSMTDVLGENFDQLRLELNEDYPNKVFGLFNYGFGSTNILSVMDRLVKPSQYQGRELPAILDRYFDVIIIESFGHNPLSQLPLGVGLMKQTETLDEIVAWLVYSHPESVIVFLATISPSQEFYGKGVVELTGEQRNAWANERRAYIENHINYAKRHNIPLIDVYAKSLDDAGQTLLKYVSSANYIHPSGEGIKLISQSISDFLFQNKILPN